MTCFALAGAGHAQIGKGKLGGLKDKVKGKGKSSTPTVAVTAYDKHMKAGQAAENDGDFVKAYKEYSAALEEKSGDYSAKSSRDAAAGEAKSQYFKKMEDAKKAGECDEMERLADESLTIFSSWHQAEYFKKEVPKCKEGAGAAKAKEANAAALATLAKGQGHISTDFVFNGPKDAVNVGDDMVVRFMFEKTMIEYAEDFGVSPGHFAYGFLNVYINGEKKMSHTYSFASNISKVWEYIDIPVNLDPEFVKKLEADNSLLQTPQDIWMFQQSFNPELGTMNYVEEAVPYAKKGDFTVTVEFGLGEKGAEKASGIVAKKDIPVKVDEAGMEKFVMRGPRYLRPLRKDEVGKCSAQGSNFGSEHISIIVDLPHPPKYYNQKWCQEGIPATCDYDQGDLKVIVYLDGKHYEYLDAEIAGKAYKEDTKLNFVVLPKTDGEMFSTTADEDRIDGVSRLNHDGDYISKIIDEINGGKIAPGKHTVKIRIFAEEVVPKKEWNRDDLNQITWEEFYADYDPIAEGEVTFNVTKEGIAKYQAKTYLDVPKAKVAKWATTEAQLKTQISDPNIVVKAVNIRWADWNVNYDAFKRPVSRETSADVYYFNKKTNSYRYLYSQKVKADYSGGAWGKAYWNEPIKPSMNTSSGGLDAGINYPVPGNLKF